MQRLLPAIAVAVGALILPGAAGAQAPAQDSVIGGLTDNFSGVRNVHIDARSGPAGEQATGTVGWHVGGGLGPDWDATVTCLSVNGQSAIIGFTGDFRFFGETTPVAGLVRVLDGGGPDSRQDTFEWADTAGQPGGPPIPGPTDCSAFPSGFNPGFGVAVNEFGDLVVTDARALPTTKAQCKNGGWQTYGVFKNQGDCVSFVATKGKNPPANP
jgi:hypothetical protein